MVGNMRRFHLVVGEYIVCWLDQRWYGILQYGPVLDTLVLYLPLVRFMKQEQWYKIMMLHRLNDFNEIWSSYAIATSTFSIKGKLGKLSEKGEMFTCCLVLQITVAYFYTAIMLACKLQVQFCCRNMITVDASPTYLHCWYKINEACNEQSEISNVWQLGGNEGVCKSRLTVCFGLSMTSDSTAVTSANLGIFAALLSSPNMAMIVKTVALAVGEAAPRAAVAAVLPQQGP